jgi:hypothetical protein
MKELAGVILATALLFGMSALAVHRFDDRETFVAPPDAVAEGFVREVLTKRWDRARIYLDDPSMSDAELRTLQRAWGEPSNVEAEIVSRTDDRALVNVTVRSQVVRFALTFDREWKVERARIRTPAV